MAHDDLSLILRICRRSCLINPLTPWNNILTEQSRLNAFGSTIVELRTTIRNSTTYLSDLKVVKELPESESRLKFMIEARLQTAVGQIQLFTNKTSVQLDEVKMEWYGYLVQLDKLGLKKVMSVMQVAYVRQYVSSATDKPAE